MCNSKENAWEEEQGCISSGAQNRCAEGRWTIGGNQVGGGQFSCCMLGCGTTVFEV